MNESVVNLMVRSWLINEWTIWLVQVEMGSPLTSNMWHMDSAPSELFWNPTCAGAGHGLPNGSVLNPGPMLL